MRPVATLRGTLVMFLCGCEWCDTGKGNWRDGSSIRESDRDSMSRGKHSRDDLRDER